MSNLDWIDCWVLVFSLLVRIVHGSKPNSKCWICVELILMTYSLLPQEILKQMTNKGSLEKGVFSRRQGNVACAKSVNPCAAKR